MEPEPLRVIRPSARPSWLVSGILAWAFAAFWFVVLAQGSGTEGRATDAATCATACRTHDPTWIGVLFATGMAVVGTAAFIVWWHDEIRIYHDAIALRRIGRTKRIAWREMSGVSLQRSRSGRTRVPVPVITTFDGRRIEIGEMSRPFASQWTRKSHAAATDLVALIDARIGSPPPLPDPPPSSKARTPMPGVVIGVVATIIGLMLVPLAVGFVTLPFADSTASVDQASVPEGRTYWGYEYRDGSLHYSVACPPPARAAFGDDPLCRPQARSSLTVAAVGAPVTIGLLVAGILWLRWTWRKRHRQPEPPARDQGRRPFQATS